MKRLHAAHVERLVAEHFTGLIKKEYIIKGPKGAQFC